MLSLKTFLRKGLGFINVGSVFKRKALSRKCKNKTFFIFEGQKFTYGDVYEKALLFSHFFHDMRRERLGKGQMEPGEKLAVGLYQENTPEFVFLLFGAAMSDTTIFGINTGFRGETLVNVIDQANIALLFADKSTIQEIKRIFPELKSLQEKDLLLVGETTEEEQGGFRKIDEAISEYKYDPSGPPRVKIDNFSPLMVIYTSGTTGAPKGVLCSHVKCIGAGFITKRRIGLTKNDRGYVCMPLFHSNAILLGVMPIMAAGGSFLLKRRFSASAFEEDVLEGGITYMNYVGQPIHYILVALEKKYGSEEAVESALKNHPKNHFRIAHGNGAPPIDRKKLIQYLGMEHVYELYGSTEAPVTTIVMPGDPIESVGALDSKKIMILNENDESCPPGILDDKGILLNYDEAVGEIVRKMDTDNIFFDGYFKNSEASNKKYRDGFYRSGDLGHICLHKRKRFLYFDGRTDDWIRKDGENFSAENVSQYALNLPGVDVATAFGAPCEVSDEKVMVALKLAKGEEFDPQNTFDWFMKQQQGEGMDPKWMPDYIRIVGEFSETRTHKILIRPLKRAHFNIEKNPDMTIYFRVRGDTSYRLLTAENYTDIKKQFEEIGRLPLLESG